MAYEINININGDVEAGTVVQGGISNTQKTSEQQKAVSSLGKYVASQTIQPFIQNVKTQVTQNIGLVTGSTDLQQRVNFAMETVQFGVQTFQNAQAGAVIGSALGIGAGAGFGIGLALTAISTAMNIAFNAYQLQLKEEVENYQLDQVRTRAGSAYNRSRRGV
jgi:hypothetical protein